jgi:hypothetical protein
MGEDAPRSDAKEGGATAAHGSSSSGTGEADPRFVRYLKVVSVTVGTLAAIAAAVGALATDCYKDVHLFENIAADEADAARAATKDPAPPHDQPAAAPRDPPPAQRGETLAVPYYGKLTIGGPCDRGEHALTGTWNCDATSTRRVHCQNGMVAVDICPARCKHEPNGANDLCE